MSVNIGSILLLFNLPAEFRRARGMPQLLKARRDAIRLRDRCK